MFVSDEDLLKQFIFAANVIFSQWMDKQHNGGRALDNGTVIG